MLFRFMISLAAIGFSLPTYAQTTLPDGVEFEKLDTKFGEAVMLGKGPDNLVFLPCAACRWQQFDELMARNVDRYNMLAITLPGYSNSPYDPEAPLYSYYPAWHDMAVEHVRAAIDAAGFDEFTLVGSSFGSSIAQEYAHKYPEGVLGLINLDGWVYPTTPNPKSLEEQLILAQSVRTKWMQPLEDDFPRLQRFNTPSIHARPDRKLLYHGWFMATPPNAIFAYWWENMLLPDIELFKKAEYPMLDVRAIRPWDETPEETRRNAEEAVARLNPGSNFRQIFLYDTPHFIMEERPELTDKLIADFVAGQPASDFRPAQE